MSDTDKNDNDSLLISYQKTIDIVLKEFESEIPESILTEDYWDLIGRSHLIGRLHYEVDNDEPDRINRVINSYKEAIKLLSKEFEKESYKCWYLIIPSPILTDLAGTMELDGKPNDLTMKLLYRYKRVIKFVFEKFEKQAPNKRFWYMLGSSWKNIPWGRELHVQHLVLTG